MFTIPYTNIQLGKVKAEVSKRQPLSLKVLEKIIQIQKTRTRRDIEDWKGAINSAQSILRPNRKQLMDVYEDIGRDGHITGIVGAIKNKIKAKKFQVGEDDKQTEIFQKKWFFELLDLFVESYFYGYSLLQFKGIKDNSFTGIEEIPRCNVVPEWEVVLKNALQSTKKDSIPYNLPPYDKWTLFIGSKKLGLFDVAAPHALGKKNLLISCWQNAELFGMPFRKGHTDLTDEERRKNMEKMLANIGTAGWGLFDTDDKIDYLEASKTDAFKVYIEPMKFSNQEISKAFAGQTGVFEENTYVGSSEVHERLFEEFIKAFLRDSNFLINNELIPKMQRLGISIRDPFSWVDEEYMTKTEKVNQVANLSKTFEIDPEFAEEYTGIKILGQKTGMPTAHESIINSIEDMYKGFDKNK